MTAPSSSSHLLPKSLNRLTEHNFAKPVHYQIRLEPAIELQKVATQQKITFETVRDPAQNFKCYLNTHSGTSVESAKLNGEPIQFEPAEAQDGKDYSGFVVQFTIPESQKDAVREVKSQFDVEITCTTEISEDLQGQYIANFKSDTAEPQKILSTQFESHFARRAFLCVDEPEAKATFEATIVVDDELDVYFNTPVKQKKKLDSGKVAHEFPSTPILSPYLIAYAIGKFVKKSKVIKNTDGTDITIEVAGPKDVNTKLDMALKFASANTQTLIDLFGHFPRSHVTHLGLPDFRSGAMENDGLITYRDSIFIVDENTPLVNKIYCSLVIAHEIAHHYFGNLVTMKWWNDLWLNESFATIVEFYAAQLTHERLGEISQFEPLFFFLSRDKLGGMSLDSMKNTHPISMPVVWPEEVETIFDAISYNKGATVLWMLIQYMTPEKFFAGIRRYLEQYKYSNAEGTDLWKVLGVEKMMYQWTTQKGFPVVSFQYNEETNQIVLTQERYQSSVEDDSSQLWPIPIRFEYTLDTGKKKEFNQLMETQSLTVDLGGKIKTIKFDVNWGNMMFCNPDKKLHELALQSYSTFSNIERIFYFQNLKFLMKSFNGVGEPRQYFSNVTIRDYLNVVETLDIHKDDHAGRCGLQATLGHFLHIAKLVDSQQPGTHAAAKRKVSQILSKHGEPNLNLGEITDLIPYEANSGLLSLILAIDDSNTENKLLEAYDAAKADPASPLKEHLIRYAYGVHMKRRIVTLPDEQAKTELKNLLKKISEESFSRKRMMMYGGVVGETPGSLVPTLFDFALSNVRSQDTHAFYRGLTKPGAFDAYARYFDSNAGTTMLTKSSPERIEMVKAFKGCSSQIAVDILQKHDAANRQKASKFAESRIYGETIDYVMENLKCARIFKSQYADLL